MTFVLRFKRALLLGLTLTGLGLSSTAFAAGTLSGTNVLNRATVQYTSGGTTETIESSPTGNSTTGAGNGADTEFLVDNVVDITVAEVSDDATSVTPSEADAVTTFTVTNTGNTTQDFALTAVNLATGQLVDYTAGTDLSDDNDANNVRVFVDNALGIVGTYDPLDTATFIDSLDPDQSATVFIVVDIPASVTGNGHFGVSLTAQAADAGSGAVTITTETVGADTANAVDVVFGDGAGTDDAANDGQASDRDGYLFSAASLTVTKTSTVISDPFNNTTNPKAIPGAVMEYEVTIENTGTSSATSVSISDAIDANLSFLAGQYNAGASDVEIVQNAVSSFCVADAADGDGDGCALDAGTLTVDPTGGLSVGNTPPNNTAIIRFRVTIQ